jgi:hypothetical protein
MPHSDNYFNKKINQLIKKLNYQKYLDIGPGYGKYGRMIREFKPKAHIEGIEADWTYILRYKLWRIYNKIHFAQAEKFFSNSKRFDFRIDLVIIGDCLEHLKKSDGLDLLHFLIYRCKHMIIVYPDKYIQFDLKGHIHEAHRSVWTKDDFKPFSHKHFRHGLMNLVVLQGYLSNKEAIVVKDSDAD